MNWRVKGGIQKVLGHIPFGERLHYELQKRVGGQHRCALGRPAHRPLMHVRVRPVSPDPERLTALAAPPDRWTWWEDRLRRCHARLAGAGP